MSALPKQIRPKDIESKFRELQGEVDVVTDDVRSYAATAGVAIGVVILLLAFFLGLRRGKKTSTVVEIRRF
jgi:hypothetical protein